MAKEPRRDLFKRLVGALAAFKLGKIVTVPTEGKSTELHMVVNSQEILVVTAVTKNSVTVKRVL